MNLPELNPKTLYATALALLGSVVLVAGIAVTVDNGNAPSPDVSPSVTQSPFTTSSPSPEPSSASTEPTSGPASVLPRTPSSHTTSVKPTSPTWTPSATTSPPATPETPDLSVCPDGDLCPDFDGSGLGLKPSPSNLPEYDGDAEWWGSDN